MIGLQFGANVVRCELRFVERFRDVPSISSTGIRDLGAIYL
jgi:hypothetical protein